MRVAFGLLAVMWVVPAFAQKAGPTFAPPEFDPPKPNAHLEYLSIDLAEKAADSACGADRVDRCEDLGGEIEVEYSQTPNDVLVCVQKGCTCQRCTPKTLATMAAGGVPIKDPIGGGPIKYGTGRPASLTSSCRCVVTSYVETQVTNALRGDVGLVPSSGSSGDEVVRTVTATIGQYHRHAVIYLDGANIRHATAYNAFTDDDLESTSQLKMGVLANGIPGILSQSVSGALSKGRLASTGLVLKPAYEIFRVMFENAADNAEAAEGYYKISDYTTLESWSKPYSTSASDMDYDDLKGTHCSGLVYWSFTEAGFVITLSEYDEDIRQDAAQAVFDEVKAQIQAGFTDVEAAISFVVTGTAKKLANQVVNCFAGLGCDDNSDTWQHGVGEGLSVSPDNLLPTDFTLGGSGSATWFGSRIDPGDDVDNDNGAATTPFMKVEPQNLAEGYYQVTTLTTW